MSFSLPHTRTHPEALATVPSPSGKRLGVLREISDGSSKKSVISPDDKHIFTTGHEETPDGRRLGPAGCWNHPSAIFKLELPDVIPEAAESVELAAERLTSPTLACHSPHVTPAFRRERYRCGSGESVPKCSVDSVSELAKMTPSLDCTLINCLPNPFYLLHLGSSAVILRISLQSGAVVNLAPSSKHAWNVLGTDGKNGILGIRSSIKSPPELAVAYVPESWRVIDKPELTASTREKLNGIESTLLDIPDHFPTQVITVQVAGRGGYLLYLYPMADALIGRAGELDVNDCYGSIQHLIGLGRSQEGPGKDASVMRNPVIAAREIASVSDIPDWAFLEFGTAFGPTTTENFVALQKASPIAHIDSTQVPVLLLVGDSDRRVSNSQAKNYFHALKGATPDELIALMGLQWDRLVMDNAAYSGHSSVHISSTKSTGIPLLTLPTGNTTSTSSLVTSPKLLPMTEEEKAAFTAV
ncbi:hypothetical protein BU17DRAFT_97132 [Hysterangium stoloniferum]|nr:hypothetical protein BU17DRAFT_97132 [Hysterangium stoloniferum]